MQWRRRRATAFDAAGIQVLNKLARPEAGVVQGAPARTQIEMAPQGVSEDFDEFVRVDGHGRFDSIGTKIEQRKCCRSLEQGCRRR